MSHGRLSHVLVFDPWALVPVQWKKKKKKIGTILYRDPEPKTLYFKMEVNGEVQVMNMCIFELFLTVNKHTSNTWFKAAVICS